MMKKPGIFIVRFVNSCYGYGAVSRNTIKIPWHITMY